MPAVGVSPDQNVVAVRRRLRQDGYLPIWPADFRAPHAVGLAQAEVERVGSLGAEALAGDKLLDGGVARVVKRDAGSDG